MLETLQVIPRVLLLTLSNQVIAQLDTLFRTGRNAPKLRPKGKGTHVGQTRTRTIKLDVS